MIEVNLLPGSKKKGRARRRPAFAIPRIDGLGGDPWTRGAALLVVVALVAIGWLHFSVAGQAEELEVAIEAAARDSVRLADVIERADGLRARRDSIAERVAIIQEIDGSRYVWPHILDEVARALPDHTWLTRIQQITSGGPPGFRIEGRAGTIFALTSFMEALEASHFIRGTTLISSDQAAPPGGASDARRVYNFVLEASYQEPPSELIDTEPLFNGMVRPPAAEEG